jgi:hypothetical protein
MPRRSATPLATAVALSLALPATAFGSELDDAQQLCQDKIREVYGVSHLRDVWSEQLGNHKFKVHGKVKADNHLYPFDCKVKHGQVQSYAYSGPHDRHEKDDNSNLGAAIAIGAGLAIVAAIAASQSGDGDKQGSSSLTVRKSVLEDDCHDGLESRLRYDRNGSAQIALRNTHVKGNDLVGEATVTYYDENPNRATFTCHFDKHGRLLDSSYHLY